MWSSTVAAILVAGLTISMVAPSAGIAFEQGVGNYANTVGTYLNIRPNGYSLDLSQYSQLLPPSIISEIRNIPGVQAVYPILTNRSGFVYRNVTISGLGHFNELTVEEDTALIGGDSGFPTGLIQILQGRMPRPGAAEFVSFSSSNATASEVGLNATKEMVMGGVQFNATLVGIAAANPPVVGNLGVLFDSSFLSIKLGQSEFSQMFQRSGYNYVVVKAQDIDQVDNLSRQITNLLKPYPVYQTQYDPASIVNLRTLISRTAPLYQALGVLSLGATVIVTSFVAWLGLRRRSWEAGLLVTQGWKWQSVSRFYFSYYVVLLVLSFSVAILLSLIISPLIGFDLKLYGQDVGLKTALQPLYVLATLAVALGTSVLIPLLLTTRLKQIGLDSILRDY